MEEAASLDALPRLDAPWSDDVTVQLPSVPFVEARQLPWSAGATGAFAPDRDDRLRGPDRFWARVRSPLPADPLVQACALAYLTDLGTGFGAAIPFGVRPRDRASDHSVWFHAPTPADDWLLIERPPAKATGTAGVPRDRARPRRRARRDVRSRDAAAVRRWTPPSGPS